MQGILSPYLWTFCLVYIGDIVVFLKTYKDNIEHLDQVGSHEVSLFLLINTAPGT